MWQQFLLILCYRKSPKVLLLSTPVPAMESAAYGNERDCRGYDSLLVKQPPLQKSQNGMLAVLSNHRSCWVFFFPLYIWDNFVFYACSTVGFPAGLQCCHAVRGCARPGGEAAGGRVERMGSKKGLVVITLLPHASPVSFRPCKDDWNFPGLGSLHWWVKAQYGCAQNYSLQFSTVMLLEKSRVFPSYHRVVLFAFPTFFLES